MSPKDSLSRTHWGKAVICQSPARVQGALHVYLAETRLLPAWLHHRPHGKHGVAS